MLFLKYNEYANLHAIGSFTSDNNGGGLFGWVSYVVAGDAAIDAGVFRRDGR